MGIENDPPLRPQTDISMPDVTAGRSAAQEILSAEPLTLSKHWMKLSEMMYGEQFIDELAQLLREHTAQHVLECACGGGHILEGLGQRGFTGIGIDADPEMIEAAYMRTVPGIEFRHLDWSRVEEVPGQFDLVMCRGNSIGYAGMWNKDEPDFDRERSEEMLERSIDVFFAKTKPGGLLYIDTTGDDEIVKMANDDDRIILPGTDFHLDGKLEYDHPRRMRKTSGTAKWGNQVFQGGSVGLLVTPAELEELLRKRNPQQVFRPALPHEQHYTAVCAIK